MIAVGIDSIYQLFYRVHDRFGVMSQATDADASCAPFSATRGGFVMGEGGFGLWLEQGTAWAERGAARIGEILGVGAAGANVGLNAWPDGPEPLVRTMKMALDDAGIAPREIDVVYASANASRGLDDVEARALTELFGGSRTVVTSIKGAIGESGSSGAAACVAALLCGAARRIPPIAGLEEADDVAAGLRLARAGMAGPAQTVLINSVASGGALFSVVLRVDPKAS